MYVIQTSSKMLFICPAFDNITMLLQVLLLCRVLTICYWTDSGAASCHWQQSGPMADRDISESGPIVDENKSESGPIVYGDTSE